MVMEVPRASVDSIMNICDGRDPIGRISRRHRLMIRSPEDITPVLKRALDYRHDPVLIGGHVDYRDNHKLFETVHENSFH